MILRALGARVRSRREERGWSRRQLAERAGLSERFLADVENGVGNLSVQRLDELAEALGTTIGGLTAGLGERKIALVGLRGAGKSTVGTALANGLGWGFVEVDQRVEQVSGMRLGDLFEYHGAARYREVERGVLEGLMSSAERLVLATGGSLVTDAESWALLRTRARTVWLRARPETHLARVEAQGDFRPMRGRRDALTELKEILRVRAPLYAQADVVVDTDGLGVDEVVEQAGAGVHR